MTVFYHEPQWVFFVVEREEEKREKVDVYWMLPGCFVVVILQKYVFDLF